MKPSPKTWFWPFWGPDPEPTPNCTRGLRFWLSLGHQTNPSTPSALCSASCFSLISVFYPSTVNLQLQPWIRQTARSVFHLRQQNQLVALTVGLRASTKLSKLIFSSSPCDHKTISSIDPCQSRSGREETLQDTSVLLWLICPQTARIRSCSPLFVFRLWCGLSSHKEFLFCFAFTDLIFTQKNPHRGS